jgi:hypothetical protein
MRRAAARGQRRCCLTGLARGGLGRLLHGSGLRRGRLGRGDDLGVLVLIDAQQVEGVRGGHGDDLGERGADACTGCVGATSRRRGCWPEVPGRVGLWGTAAAARRQGDAARARPAAAAAPPRPPPRPQRARWSQCRSVRRQAGARRAGPASAGARRGLQGAPRGAAGRRPRPAPASGDRGGGGGHCLLRAPGAAANPPPPPPHGARSAKRVLTWAAGHALAPERQGWFGTGPRLEGAEGSLGLRGPRAPAPRRRGAPRPPQCVGGRRGAAAAAVEGGCGPTQESLNRPARGSGGGQGIGGPRAGREGRPAAAAAAGGARQRGAGRGGAWCGRCSNEGGCAGVETARREGNGSAQRAGGGGSPGWEGRGGPPCRSCIDSFSGRRRRAQASARGGCEGRPALAASWPGAHRRAAAPPASTCWGAPGTGPPARAGPAPAGGSLCRWSRS